jgi:hypothetical protein
MIRKITNKTHYFYLLNTLNIRDKISPIKSTAYKIKINIILLKQRDGILQYRQQLVHSTQIKII